MASVTKSVMVDVDVDVDVNPTDLETDELIKEIESRGYAVIGGEASEDWQALADAFCFNRNPQQMVADLIYRYTGRIVTVK